MEIFQVAALVILVLGIAYRERIMLAEAVPVAVSLLVLVLYGFSFFNGLLLTDYLAFFCCVLAVAGVLAGGRDARGSLWRYLKQEAAKPGNWAALVLLLAVPLLVSQKVVTWWDDYNFWATDAKSIFYLNGFADKYQNVAAEFGDYPPGTQMMKWWFLHLGPDEFQEGLLFSGYYFMNLAFLVPLLSLLTPGRPAGRQAEQTTEQQRTRILTAGQLTEQESEQRQQRPQTRTAGPVTVLMTVLAAAALWLFPACVEVFGMDGCCADLTMAVVYGAFLTAVLDEEGHSSFFYFGRQALFLMILVLCKNTGFLWVAFGLLFTLGYQLQKKTGLPKTVKKGLGCVLLLPVLTEAGWLGFCLINRRVAKLTGTALHMATGSVAVPEVKKEMVQAFVTAFLRYPLHRWSTPAIDFSPLALFLFLLLGVFLLACRGYIRKQSARWLALFLAGSGSFFYAVNLISHLTVFATETQYLEPYGMVSSIERYGAPFTIGGLYLAGYLLMRECGRKGRSRGIWLCLCFVFLTTDYESAYRGLLGYEEAGKEALAERDEILDEKAVLFLLETKKLTDGGRVLYLRDISNVSWVRNTYLVFEASPVSVMYGSIDAESMEKDALLATIEDSHAGYLYADEIQGGGTLFEELTEGEEFEYGCLYQIDYADGQITLSKIGED